jgi:hypothetical protein
MYFSDLKNALHDFKHNWIAIGVFCVTLCYYLALLHVNIAHVHDAPDYYRRIITMRVSWHTHHVFYEPINFLWAEYGKLIFPAMHPFKLISAMNSFFGAGCISLIYLILVKRLNFFTSKALICCLAIGGSFYYLNYATTVEVYHSALFFMLATFYYATKNAPIDYIDAMIIGILHGFAMSFHQMHILLGIVLLPKMLQAGYGKFLIYVLYGTVIVVFTYSLACYAEHIHSKDIFIKYFLGYLENKKIIESNSSPKLAPLGLAMALLGGRYVMSIEPFKTIILAQFSDSKPELLMYLHHKTGIISGSFQIIMYTLFSVFFCLIIWQFIKTINLTTIKNQSEYYLLIVVYSLFFTFWYPHNPEFWGVSMTFLIIVIFAQIQNTQLLAMTAIAIAMINLCGSGLPLLDPDNNLYPNGVDTLFK